MDFLALIGAASFSKDIIKWIGDKFLDPVTERISAEQHLSEVQSELTEAEAETTRLDGETKLARRQLDHSEEEAKRLRVVVARLHSLWTKSKTAQIHMESKLSEAKLRLTKAQHAEVAAAKK